MYNPSKISVEFPLSCSLTTQAVGVPVITGEMHRCET